MQRRRSALSGPALGLSAAVALGLLASQSFAATPAPAPVQGASVNASTQTSRMVPFSVPVGTYSFDIGVTPWVGSPDFTLRTDYDERVERNQSCTDPLGCNFYVNAYPGVRKQYWNTSYYDYLAPPWVSNAGCFYVSFVSDTATVSAFVATVDGLQKAYRAANNNYSLSSVVGANLSITQFDSRLYKTSANSTYGYIMYNTGGQAGTSNADYGSPTTISYTFGAYNASDAVCESALRAGNSSTPLNDTTPSNQAVTLTLETTVNWQESKKPAAFTNVTCIAFRLLPLLLDPGATPTDDGRYYTKYLPGGSFTSPYYASSRNRQRNLTVFLTDNNTTNLPSFDPTSNLITQNATIQVLGAVCNQYGSMDTLASLNGTLRPVSYGSTAADTQHVTNQTIVVPPNQGCHVVVDGLDRNKSYVMWAFNLGPSNNSNAKASISFAASSEGSCAALEFPDPFQSAGTDYLGGTTGVDNPGSLVPIYVNKTRLITDNLLAANSTPNGNSTYQYTPEEPAVLSPAGAPQNNPGYSAFFNQNYLDGDFYCNTTMDYGTSSRGNKLCQHLGSEVDGQRSCNSTPECTAFVWIHSNITSPGFFYLKSGRIDLTNTLVGTREANASDLYVKILPYVAPIPAPAVAPPAPAPVATPPPPAPAPNLPPPSPPAFSPSSASVSGQSTPAIPSPTSSSGGSSTGAIVGGVVGGIVALAVIALLVVFRKRLGFCGKGRNGDLGRNKQGLSTYTSFRMNEDRQPNQPDLGRAFMQVGSNNLIEPYGHYSAEEEKIAISSTPTTASSASPSQTSAPRSLYSLNTVPTGSKLSEQASTPISPVDSTAKGSRPGTPSVTGRGSAFADELLTDIEKHSMRQRSRSREISALLDENWMVDISQLQSRRNGAGELMVLGEGGYGKVYRGLLHGTEEVAIKVVLKPTSEQLERFRQEIMLLKSCYTTSIVRFMGASITKEATFLVMEYMPQGDLLAKLNSSRAAEFSWTGRGKSIALEVCKALVWLHSKRIVHLDIKPANVLLTEDLRPKLADVGLGKPITRANGATMDFGLGTFEYAAPEQLTGPSCSFSADIFSFGVLLWEICTLARPTNRSYREIKVPSEAPQVIRDLVWRCLEAEAVRRPRAVEVHAILQDAVQQS